MKRNAVALLALALLISASPYAYAGEDGGENVAVERYTKAAQKSFDRGQYKQAESLWERAIGALDQAGINDVQQASTLKRLGETLLKEGKYSEADSKLKKAATLYQSLAIADAELAGDQAMLSQLYRAVDISLLGKLAQEAFTQASLSSFCLIKKDNGVNHVQIQLPDRYTKHIDSKDVDQLGFDRIVTFDITTLPDGAVKLDNIKGFRVRAGMWVSILQSIFRPAEAGQHVAEVTAGKMGITKTVSAHLSDDQYAPVNGLVGQLMALPAPTSDTSAAPTTMSSSTTSGSAAPETTSSATSTMNRSSTSSPITASPVSSEASAPTATSPSSSATTNPSPLSTTSITAPVSTSSSSSTASSSLNPSSIETPSPALRGPIGGQTTTPSTP